MATYRSTPAFAVGGVVPEFRCVCCGAETATMPLREVRSLCCGCAGEHPEYEYGYCVECGEEREYAGSDDDYCFGGFGPSAPEPIGIPASAMNGNAADRHNDPAGWSNWVRFCEANGHP